MTYQAINRGTVANDGTGDNLRDAAQKINSNFTEIYDFLGDGSNLSSTLPITNGGTGATTASGARAALGLAIGTDVQAYDADTAKYDAVTANFTGTLQNGGSNVVVDSDIGSTVQAYDADTTKNDVSNTFSANQIISVADNTNAALRITQTGTGNALVVEDSSNPDSTPFVVDAAGFVVTGHTSPIATVADSGSANNPKIQVMRSDLTTPSMGVYDWSTNAGITPNVIFSKSKSGTIGTRGSVSSGDYLGALVFDGDDGTSFIRGALIRAEVDGTPGANDMPGRLVFSTTADGASSPTERMRIDSSGNVGIGTTSPNSKLNVSTNSTDAAVTITQTGTGHALVIEDNDENPDSTPIVVDADGRLLVGVLSSRSVAGTAVEFLIEARFAGRSSMGLVRNQENEYGPVLAFGKTRAADNGLSTVVLANDELGRIDFAGGDGTDIDNQAASIGAFVDGTPGDNDMPGRLVFFTTADGDALPTERMRINSDGNVGIGTTAYHGPSKLAVRSTVSGTACVGYHNTGGAGSRYAVFVNGNDTAVIGTITNNGDTSTAYNTSSDYRLKEDWQPMTGSIDRLKALNPVNFAWKIDGRRVDGFLAHEAAEVVPEAVTGEKDAMRVEEYEVAPAKGDVFIPAVEEVLDEEGNVVTAAQAEQIIESNVSQPETLADGQTWRKTTPAVMGTREVPDYQGIDQSKLVPLLTAALQEAIAKIDALETRIQALESK